MIAIDIGNTETIVGLYEQEELLGHWRLQTRVGMTTDEVRAILTPLMATVGKDLHECRQVIMATVVPDLKQVWGNLFRNRAVQFVDSHSPLSFTIAVDNPTEVGADRLVNAEATYQLYGKPAIIVDAGTATTFCVLSENGAYIGGAIAPGLSTAASALVDRAALLSHVDLRPAEGFIGSNSSSALRSGVINAHAVMIDAVIARLQQEMAASKVRVVATGGLMPLLRPLLEKVDHHDELLTLRGLRLIGNRLFNGDNHDS